MKRMILGVVAVFAAATVGLTLADVFDLTTVARLLVVGGGLTLLVACLNELRTQPMTEFRTEPSRVGPQPATAQTGPATASATPPPAAPVRPVKRPMATAAAPHQAPAAPTLTDSSTVIDLREQPSGPPGTETFVATSAPANATPAQLVDELIACGQLTVTHGPITDREIPTMVMVAMAEQLSRTAA